MKTIKAWAVFGKNGELIRETIDEISEMEAWARFCTLFDSDCKKYTKQIEEEGCTVKPITITWEE